MRTLHSCILFYLACQLYPEPHNSELVLCRFYARAKVALFWYCVVIQTTRCWCPLLCVCVCVCNPSTSNSTPRLLYVEQKKQRGHRPGP